MHRQSHGTHGAIFRSPPQRGAARGGHPGTRPGRRLSIPQSSPPKQLRSKRRAFPARQQHVRRRTLRFDSTPEPCAAPPVGRAAAVGCRTLSIDTESKNSVSKKHRMNRRSFRKVQRHLMLPRLTVGSFCRATPTCQATCSSRFFWRSIVEIAYCIFCGARSTACTPDRNRNRAIKISQRRERQAYEFHEEKNLQKNFPAKFFPRGCNARARPVSQAAFLTTESQRGRKAATKGALI